LGAEEGRSPRIWGVVEPSAVDVPPRGKGLVSRRPYRVSGGTGRETHPSPRGRDERLDVAVVILAGVGGVVVVVVVVVDHPTPPEASLPSCRPQLAQELLLQTPAERALLDAEPARPPRHAHGRAARGRGSPAPGSSGGGGGEPELVEIGPEPVDRLLEAEVFDLLLLEVRLGLSREVELGQQPGLGRLEEALVLGPLQRSASGRTTSERVESSPATSKSRQGKKGRGGE